MSNLFELKDREILVTGASSGIGRACAILASRAGAKIILNARNEQRLEETKALLAGEGHRIIVGDISQADVQMKLVDALPRLDGAVFAAGIDKLKPAKFVNASLLEEVMPINFSAPYLLTCSLLRSRKLAENASVIYIGSISASFAMIGNSMYSSSKNALISAARVLAVEVAKQRIRVNVLSPGQVNTPMTERTAMHITPEALSENEAQYPLGFGQPEDIGYAAVFLLSSASRWITGQDIVIDGGYTLK